MKPRPRPCVICGVRVEGGASRCPAHATGGARPRPCMVCGISTKCGNYCQLHEPTIDEAERNARNPYRQAYKDHQYAKNRQHRFERARGRCEACYIALEPGQWECDHLVSLRDGGTNDLDNLRILCRDCHRAKTAKTRRAR